MFRLLPREEKFFDLFEQQATHIVSASRVLEGLLFEEDASYLVEKQRYEPPPPRSLIASVPPDLDALCSALLHFDPATRPKESEILGRLGAQESKTTPSVSNLTQTQPFVGRRAELAALEEALRATQAQEPVALLVEGESGVGKTPFVRALRALAEVSRGRWLHGECYAEGGAPYGAFDQALSAGGAFGESGIAAALPAWIAADLVRVDAAVRWTSAPQRDSDRKPAHRRRRRRRAVHRRSAGEPRHAGLHGEAGRAADLRPCPGADPRRRFDLVRGEVEDLSGVADTLASPSSIDTSLPGTDQTSFALSSTLGVSASTLRAQVQSTVASPSLLRQRLKLVQVYILSHEGKKDRSYSYPRDSIQIGDRARQTSSGRTLSAADMTSLFGVDWRNYRWKIYTIVTRPKNLVQ